MTDNEKILEQLQQMNRTLQKLLEQGKPKYETKVETRLKDIIWRDTMPAIECDLHGNILNNNNEKAETKDKT